MITKRYICHGGNSPFDGTYVSARSLPRLYNVAYDECLFCSCEHNDQRLNGESGYIHLYPDWTGRYDIRTVKTLHEKLSDALLRYVSSAGSFSYVKTDNGKED